MDRGRESPVICITSPPGSGKTTLIASYLDARKLPCLWYRIDEGDADIATFFHYMGIGARKLAARKSKTLPSFTPEYTQRISVFSKRYFENLFSNVKTPFLFVFDNYQNVHLNSDFHEMISHGLAEIPKDINVIILSRKQPPLPFIRMYTNEKIHPLGWEEIRFTIDEVRELVQVKAKRELNDETIRYLHKKTDGWAAGLMLMIGSIKKEHIEYQLLDRLSSKKIYDYFAHEIFQKLDRDIQTFLLKTAFLPMMTAGMAEKLTGMRNSEEILNTVVKEYYLTETYSQDKPVYHYHQLFREFLLSIVKDFITQDEISLIKQNAAVILEENGRIEDAVQLLHESDTGEMIIQIILKWAQSLIEQGRYPTLHKWLDFIPKEVFSNNPWLLYWMGVCHLPFNPAESLIHFDEAFKQFKTQKDASGAFLAWSGIVESIMYSSESLVMLDRWFPVIDELLKEFRGFPSEYIEANVTCSVVRALSLRRPTHFDMRKWVDRIHAITQTTTDIPIKMRALINLACYLYSEGDFQALENILESLSGNIQRQDVPPLARMTVAWIKAAYFNVMSMYDKCQEVISDGLELARTLGINLMEYMLLGHSVLSSLKGGDSETAKKNLQRMASAVSLVKPWQTSFYHCCSAWEALYRNNLAQALTHSEHCMSLCENLGNPWTLSMACLLKAHVAFASGEYKKSVEHVKQARLIGNQSKNEFTSFICALTEAYFYLEHGKDLPAIEAIRKGMRIGREKGYANLFMCPPGVMERILTKALECGIEVAYATDLIRKNAILPDPSHLEIEHWPWPLKIFTFGRFGIIKDGKPFQFTGKIQQKPLSMLKVMIAVGGREVTEDRLVDILWPEAEGDAAHNAFKTTLSRLRQSLGIEEAVKFADGKAALDPRYCCVDVWAFERILGQVEDIWNKGPKRSDITNAIQLAEKAVKIYTGPFLADENEPWTISVRERLQNKFLRHVRRIAQYWERTGDFEKAVEYYQKGLEVDDLAEEFYQHIIKCYLQMGRRSEAIAAYRRCYNILSSKLDIEPLAETKAILNTLKS